MFIQGHLLNNVCTVSGWHHSSYCSLSPRTRDSKITYVVLLNLPKCSPCLCLSEYALGLQWYTYCHHGDTHHLSFFYSSFVVLIFLFWDRISCIPGWPPVCWVALAFISWVLAWQVCITTLDGSPGFMHAMWALHRLSYSPSPDLGFWDSILLYNLGYSWVMVILLPQPATY